MSALLTYLPAHYQDAPEVKALLGAVEPEIEELWRAKDGLFDQMDIHKATWGLSDWERSLGLEVNVNQTNEARRARVLAKLRGSSNATVFAVKQVVSSYTTMDVDIRERVAEFTFDVRFLGTSLAPDNLEGLSAALDEMLPAHVAYDYILVAEAGAVQNNIGFAVRLGRRRHYVIPERSESQ